MSALLREGSSLGRLQDAAKAMLAGQDALNRLPSRDAQVAKPFNDLLLDGLKQTHGETRGSKFKDRRKAEIQNPKIESEQR